MSDTLITIIAIALAAILMFIFPLMTMSDRTDDVSQLTVDTATTEFVDDIRTTGKITQDKYDQFLQTIGSTGNTYNVEMEVQHLDENPGKKTTQANYTKIGENVYYSEYTTQVLEQLESSTTGEISLKEGDRIVVNVKNTNTTQAQTLKGSLLSFTNAGQYTIAASSTGMIKVNGK